jgi:hypothetical protein
MDRPTATRYNNAGYFVPDVDSGDKDPSAKNKDSGVSTIPLGLVKNGKIEGKFEVFSPAIQTANFGWDAQKMIVDKKNVSIWIKIEPDYPNQPPAVKNAPDPFYKFEFNYPYPLE